MHVRVDRSSDAVCVVPACTARRTLFVGAPRARLQREGTQPRELSVVSGIRPLPCKAERFYRSGLAGHTTEHEPNRRSGFTSLCLCVRGAGKSNVIIDEASHTAPWRIIPALRRGFRLLHTLDLRSCRSCCRWCWVAPVGAVSARTFDTSNLPIFNIWRFWKALFF